MGINEYEEIVSNTLTSKPDNDDTGYGKIVADFSGETAMSVKRSMIVAADRDPDQHAKVLEMSRKTQIPADVVERDYAQIAKEDEVEGKDYDALISESPGLGEWLSDPDHATLAKDDIDALKSIEGNIQEYGVMGGLARDLNHGLAKMNASISKVPALAVDLALTPGNLIAKAIDRPDLQSSAPDWMRSNPMTDFYENLAEQNKTAEIDMGITDEIGKGNYAKASRVMLSQFVANSPQQAATIGLMMTGYGAVGLAATGTITAAEANDQARDAGATPLEAITRAGLHGTAEAAMESVGTFGLLKSWEKQIAKQYGKSVSKEVMFGFGKQMAASVVGEANEEALTSIAQDYASRITGDEFAMEGFGKRALEAGIIGGFSGGVMTAPGGAISGVNQVRQAKLAKDMYLAMGKSAEATKLRKRAPEMQRKFIEQVTKSGAVENIYIPVEQFESYFQSKGITPAKAAQDVGATNALDDAKLTGADVEIPLAAWVDKVVGTEHYEALANDIKFHPGESTTNQIEAARAAVAADVKTADQEATTPKTSDQQIDDVVQRVETQLKDAGIEPTQAAIVRGIAVLAQREGLDPNQYFEELNLRIGRGGTGSPQGREQTFNQAQRREESYAPYETQRAEFSDFLAAAGKPVVKGQPIMPHMLRAAGATPEMVERLKTFNKIDPNAEVLAPFQNERRFNQSSIPIKDSIGPEYFENPEGKGDQFLGQIPTPVLDMIGTESKAVLLKENIALDNKTKHGAEIKGRDVEILQAALTNPTHVFQSKPKTKPNYWTFVHKGDASSPSVVVEIAIGKDNFEVVHWHPMREKSFQQQIKRAEREGGRVLITEGITTQGSAGLSDLPLSTDSVSNPDAPVNGEDPEGNQGGGGGSFRQDDGDTPRGQIRIGEKSINIDLFKNANSSTFIHEAGHLYLEILSRFSKREGVTAETKADMEKLLKWFEVDSVDQIETKHHEMFARGFEKYIGEGVAPSAELRSTFNRFKIWIISVYQRLENLNVELTDEVRDVMGRMLTAESEVTQAQERTNQAPLFADPVAAGMTGDQAIRYQNARTEARQSAVDEVNGKLMADLKRKQRADYVAKREAIVADLNAQLNNSLVYKALAILQKGENADGTPLTWTTPVKLDRSTMSKEQAKAMPRGVFSAEGNGLSPDEAAEILGFKNGLELIESLSKAPPRNVVVKERADKQMAELYPDLMNDPTLPDEAEKAVHTEKRAQMLRMELEHLASNNMPVLKGVMRKIAKRPPSERAVRDEVERILSKKKVGEIKPYLYYRAEVKAAREAGELLARGDVDGAFEAKRRELLNHELYREAVRIQTEVDKQTTKFKRIFRSDADVSKTRDINLVSAARAVLAGYGLGAASDKTADQFLTQLKQYDEDSYNAISALVTSATLNAGPYETVTFEAFSDMADSVNALWDLAKSSREIEVDGKRISREDAMLEMENKIAAITTVPAARLGYDKAVTTWEKTKMKLLGARASMTRVEHWADAVDVQRGGPFTKYIWNPVSEATTKYRLEKERVLKSYKKILTDHRSHLSRDPISANEIGYTFRDKTELLMALLHTGNQSNKDKLLRGRKWGELTMDDTVDTSRWDRFVDRMHAEGVLVKQDYEFAQNIWDLMESVKPGAQNAHKQMYGYYFNEITAHDVVTPFGTFKGGYVPAKVDPYTNEDTKIRQERETLEKNNNSFQFPTTGRGFTKGRVDQYAEPLSLELSLLGGHIDGVMRFTHIEPRVKEVSRIVMDKNFRKSLAVLDSQAGAELLVPWLQRAAQQKVVLPSDSGIGKLMDWGARYLRKSVAMQMMVGNVTNTLQQVTGVIVAAAKVKPRHLRNGLITYMRDIRGTSTMIMEKSDFMRSTQGSTLYETQQAVEKIIVDPSTFETIQEFATKHTYFLQSATQNIVNTVVWVGAYEQAVEQGMDERAAVREADSAVRLTQGTNAAEDISRFETGTATSRLFTQFAGYFNMLANLNAGELQKISRDVGLKKGAGRAFYVYLMAFMIPAVMSELLVQAMAGTLGDDEDDDGYANDMLSAFFGSQLRTGFALIPYAGQLGTSALNRVNNKRYDDRLSLSPVVSVVETMVGTPFEVYKNAIDEDANVSKRIVKDSLMFMGVLSALPIGPLGKPAGYLMDVSEGEVEPTGPVDFTRGLITGKRGN